MEQEQVLLSHLSKATPTTQPTCNSVRFGLLCGVIAGIVSGYSFGWIAGLSIAVLIFWLIICLGYIISCGENNYLISPLWLIFGGMFLMGISFAFLYPTMPCIHLETVATDFELGYTSMTLIIKVNSTVHNPNYVEFHTNQLTAQLFYLDKLISERNLENVDIKMQGSSFRSELVALQFGKDVALPYFKYCLSKDPGGNFPTSTTMILKLSALIFMIKVQSPDIKIKIPCSVLGAGSLAAAIIHDENSSISYPSHCKVN
jgi:hypothetical protein